MARECCEPPREALIARKLCARFTRACSASFAEIARRAPGSTELAPCAWRAAGSSGIDVGRKSACFARCAHSVRFIRASRRAVLAGIAKLSVPRRAVAALRCAGRAHRDGAVRCVLSVRSAAAQAPDAGIFLAARSELGKKGVVDAQAALLTD